MSNINTELPELIQKLEDKLRDKGHCDVSIRTQHTPEGVEIFFVVNGRQVLDKYTIYNREDGTHFIRTLFL